VGASRFDGVSWQNLGGALIQAGSATDYAMTIGPNGLPIVADSEYVGSESGDRLFKSYSFPSGHALYSLCFYGVLASLLAAHAPPGAAPIGIYVAAALLIAGIGLSRVYLGVHYPSDVIAGYLAAAFVIGAVFAFSPG
jgi:membrane-associated phospholipid phosphatase